ncbi:MAG: transglutaminase-like cysteine peptidase [Burkholderiaceae bacterium]
MRPIPAHVARCPRGWRARGRGLGLVLSLLVGVVSSGGDPRAWDQDRMLAAAQKVGPGAVAGARALQPVLAGALKLDETARLVAINDFYNRRIVFREDVEIWQLPDYWASPLETLNQGQGDCEDYAIAKYFSLLALGIPTAKLRLVYVRAELGGPGGVQQPHMVLAYYAAPDAEPLILDNLLGEVRSASRRPDLTPVFSFNSDGLWQGVGGASAGDPLARLSRWRAVLAKARTEGFE